MGLKVQYLPQYTIEDYMSWEGDWELIHGIPYAMSPSPTSGHQRTGLNVMHLLKDTIDKSSCKCEIFYDLDWHIKVDTVVRPDVVILCGDKLKDNFISRIPSLVVEILSPSTQEKDRTLKAELYADAGVVNYVIIDHLKQSVDVFLITKGKYELNQSRTLLLGECEIAPNWSNVFDD